jgi:hypothetical protein
MHDIPGLESLIKELQTEIAGLTADDLEALLGFIHRPGWTTIAEFKLVQGVTESLLVQVKALKGLQQTLIEGARVIGEGEEGKA